MSNAGYMNYIGDMPTMAERIATAFGLSIVEGYPQGYLFWLRCEGEFNGLSVRFLCEQTSWPDHMIFHLNAFEGDCHVAQIIRFYDGSIYDGSISRPQGTANLAPLMFRGLTVLGFDTSELISQFGISAHEVTEWTLRAVRNEP